MAHPSPATRRAAKGAARRGGNTKPCGFCREDAGWVDYKDVNLLRRFVSERGKIRARRVSGNCARHQRDVAMAVKVARELALLPYAERTVAERDRIQGRQGSGRGRREGAATGAVTTTTGKDGLDVGIAVEGDAGLPGAEEE